MPHFGHKTVLELKPLDVPSLAAAAELDRRCLGGLWSLAGYQRDLDSPNSDLLALIRREAIADHPSFSRSPLSPASPTLLGLGCLWSILEEAHITILAVHPNYQRQGLGQALLYHLLVCAQQRGLEWATLEVRESNQAARSLYHKFGFKEVGRRRRYYQDTGEDALILWCKGLQSVEFQHQLHGWQSQLQTRLQQAGWQLVLD
jgi:ribosomal-protein-alanine N-acetyltransferase